MSRCSTPTILLLLIVTAMSVGCESTVEPYSGRGAYSVYGALTLAQGQQRQFIRVKPLEQPIVSAAEEPLPATATITNLSEDRTYSLTDSIIVFGENIVTHNYTSVIDIQPKTEYRLTVEGPNGRTTQATTLTPTDTEATIAPSGSTPGPPTDTVDVDSGKLHCRTRFEIEHHNAKVPYQASVGLTYNGQQIWLSQSAKIHELGDGETQGFGFTPNGVLSRVDEESFDDPSTCRYAENRCRNLDAGRVQVAYTYLGPQWFGQQPDDGASPGFDPSRARTVQNGLGFFGSFFRDTLSVTIHRGVIDLGPEACGPPF